MMISFKNIGKNKKFLEESDLTTNPLYMRRMAVLIKDANQKGQDIVQLANGDIIMTETRILTYQYVWNGVKGKFERAKYGSKSQKINTKENTEKESEIKNSSNYKDKYQEENNDINDGITETTS